jgi:hypothetical protein
MSVLNTDLIRAASPETAGDSARAARNKRERNPRNQSTLTFVDSTVLDVVVTVESINYTITKREILKNAFK